MRPRSRTVGPASGEKVSKNMVGRMVTTVALWLLGYPDQALRQQHAADTLAQEVAHPPSLSFTRMLAAIAHQSAP
jgi:hypothetical protein